MSRRISFVMAALLLAAPLALASDDAADRVCIRDVVPSVTRLQPELRAMFALPAQESLAQSTDQGTAVFMTPEAPELLVARIGADGKPVVACVDNAAAATRFLEAPLTSIPTKQAKEQ